MPWTRAETGQANLDFEQVLLECEDYAPHVAKLMPHLQREDHTMWYWSGMGFRIALAYRISPGDCYIKAAVPSLEGNTTEKAKEILKKLRKEMDILGITEWRSTQIETYASEQMLDFTDAIDRICHEFRGDEVRSGKRQMEFTRKPENIADDAKFEGRGKDRPARVKEGA